MENLKYKWKSISEFLQFSSPQVKLSMILMGAGHIGYGAVKKGLVYLFIELAMVIYLIRRGVKDLVGFFTLGTVQSDAWTGVEGDNSIIMLLMGIFAWIVVIAFLWVYVQNLRGAYAMQIRKEKGIPNPTLKQELDTLLDRKFYVLVLILPVIGVCVFNILPIIFMILIAFTNYGGEIVPPQLVDWVGLDNFRKLLVLHKFAPTLGKILSWNLVWAVLSTALNYFAGLGLALLLNKECVKGKAFWRAFQCWPMPSLVSLPSWLLNSCSPMADLSIS